MVVLGQKHQQAACNADLRGQARALGANGVLDDLHHQRLTFKHLFFNGQLRLGLAGKGWWLPIRLTVPHIGHMQKSRTLQPDVDERRLHARQHARNLAQVHVAHQPTLQRALDVQLLHRPVFHDGHAGFLGRPVDQNVLLDSGHGRYALNLTQRSRWHAATGLSRTSAGP